MAPFPKNFWGPTALKNIFGPNFSQIPNSGLGLTCMIEEWKQIEDTHYSVSNLGRVVNNKTGKFVHREESIWSTDLQSKRKSGSAIHKNTKLIDGKVVRMDMGYVIASIGGKSRRVHRLVAEAFLSLDDFTEQIGITTKEWKGMPDRAKEIIKESMHINHINHNKTDNSVNNLEWVTPQENCRAHSNHKKKVTGKNALPIDNTQTLINFIE